MSERRYAYAHTPNGNGEWHKLADHLAGTAERAAAFAEPFGAAELARTAGWLHDAGKCSDTFSAYLRACDTDGDEEARRTFPVGSRDHKRPGALRASDLHPTWGTLLATTILGHHGGMSDLAAVRSRLLDAADDLAVAEALARFDEQVGRAPFPLLTEGPAWLADPPTERAARDTFTRDVEMLVRLIFSALVDADFLDTEAHFNRSASQARAGDRSLEGLLERFECRRQSVLAPAADTAVNRSRSEMYGAVLANAALPPGLYRLAAPTGAGKTQIGLGWALAHAAANGLRRIVTAVPFITVTDGVANVYGSLLNEEDDHVVVEHHSQVTGDDGWQKLASENWDSAVVVTTTVRLFESLFWNRPSDCRRLHRLARSVIVLDEFQAIPVEVLDPVVDALRALVDRFGATVLIMTATQPTLEHVRPTAGRPALDLLPEVDRWSGVFRRTEICQAGSLTHLQVAALVSEHAQCLCIANTIGDAREITRATGDAEVLHLSTMLRPADRYARLEDIGRRLADGRECRVVSTQLIEAGVDLDFPVVLRAMAPLPSLAQADGRCNRNGTLASGLGKTIVFELIGGKAPPGAYYSVGTAHALVMFAGGHDDFRTLDAVAEWYGRFLNDPTVHQDARHVQVSRFGFQYETTASAFRMIDDDTVAVAVPWPQAHPHANAVERVLRRLQDETPVGPSEVRALQDVTVSLRRRLAEQAVRDRLAEPVSDHLLEWTGAYDEQLGLTFGSVPQEVLIW